MNPEDNSYAETVESNRFESAKANVSAKIVERLRTDEIRDEINALRWQEFMLQSSEDEEDDNHRQELRIAQRDKFECLKRFADNIAIDFYRNYYASLRRRLKTKTYAERQSVNALDRYMNGRISKAEKYRLLRSLTISLSYGASNVNSRHCIENVLEYLTESQGLDAGFAIAMVRLLRVDPQSLDLVSHDFSLPTIIERLETARLRVLCEEQGILCTEESQVTELRGLLSSYSRETVDATIGKVKRDTAIAQLIDLFRTLNDRELLGKEEFLLNLKPGRIIDIWKRELLIRSLISRQFPAYDDWSALVGTHKAQGLVDMKYSASWKPDGKRSHTRYREFDEEGRESLRRSLRDTEEGLVYAQLFRELNHKLAKLPKCVWSEKTLNAIEKWIECLDDGRKLAELVATLDIIIEYNMDIMGSELSALISQSTLANVQKAVHKFVVDHSFAKSHEKKLDELIDELVELNAESVRLLRSKQAIRKEYDKVVAASNRTSGLVTSTKKIGDWSVSEIKDWSQSFFAYRNFSVDIESLKNLLKLGYPEEMVTGFQTASAREKEEIMNQVGATSRHEMMAVIMRAMDLTLETKVRDVQLLTMILLLNTMTRTGRLAQVNTGEGKTMIIAMTAAYHALWGSKVDVVTSSLILAIEQREQQSKFYETLMLSSYHNFGSDVAYLGDIVYGTNQQFQGDILRDEFKKHGNRHGRKCDLVIVDEVDNMLIDGNDHTVLLSSEMPGMDHLEPILAAIYTQMKQALDSTLVEKSEEDGSSRTYFVYQESALDEKGEVKEQVVLHYVPVRGTREEFVKMCTDRHIRRLIRDDVGEDEDEKKPDKDFPEIKIPKHLEELVRKSHLKRWLSMALTAQACYNKEGENFIMKDGEVTVVDADNTGVVEKNTRLSDGLHQFLQIANGARMTPERFTTNFISNVGFFRRYRPRIYGLTGTLGPEATRELLAKTYDVDTVVVPPFKLKRHIELTPIVVEEEEEEEDEEEEKDWYRSIARSCLRKLDNGRACLVIMEYIRETAKLRDTFIDEFSYSADNIKMYKMNEDSTVVKDPLKSGEMIITTNIAGRGTDVKVSSDVEAHGGLHVCVTFLPKNARVEEQNIGRTSRTGNRGTSQLVLRNAELDVGELRRERDVRNAAEMRRAEKVIARVTTMDAVFERFCSLIDEFTGDIERKAVEERFAIWLKMNGGNWRGRNGQALRDFETFKAAILQDRSDSRLIRNPYMHVQIGNAYLEKEDYASAIREYTAAINLDDNFAEHAYYNRGYAYLAEYGRNVEGNESEIDEAVKSFERARALISQREYELHFEANASHGKDFAARIRNKLSLYKLQQNIIDLAIGPDLAAIEAQLEELREKRKSDDLESAEKTGIDRAIEDLEDEAKNEGVIPTVRRRGKDLSVALHKLKNCLPEDDDGSYDREIAEFEGNGAIGAIQVSEMPPIDWGAVFTLLLLGIGQMVLGGALMVFTVGGGGTIATGLIAEGIKDIVIAVRDGIIKRCFSWASWAIEKVISLTISVACAGWTAMKDVARTMYSGAKALTTIGSGFATQAMKEGWKIVAKKLGIEFAKGVSKHIAKDLLNYGISKALLPRIQRTIADQIRVPIEEALMRNAHVETMLRLDEMNGNRHYEGRIRAMGHEILNAGKKKDLIYMVDKISKGISDKMGPGREAGRKVSEAIIAIPELLTFTHKFIDKLNGKIAEAARKDKIDEQLSTKLRKKAEEKGEKSSGNNDSKKSNPAGLCREFVKIVSGGMISIIQGKWTAPLVDAGVNYTADKITENINKAMKETIENYRNRDRIIIRHD